MPSLTVVFSSCTLIYISPGLYGPLVIGCHKLQPATPRNSFRLGVISSHARTPAAGNRWRTAHGGVLMRHIDTMAIVKVT
ncbi:hypothetical protein HEK616_13390 [Streptomyces nigrescens]|uniref:Secreted protein n=1 Tax=Streptomyces nigrescens TaxID=1920 RepID=A0ABM7ZN94_STRNI|nr:hypothetical protein HEK616_13390 [Streptomyces nigrescens]